VFSYDRGVQLSFTEGHNHYCKLVHGLYYKNQSSGTPELLHHCVIFIVCVCNLEMWPRATGWIPMSQVLCKNNSVIALVFPCPVQIAVWFLIWTIMILIPEEYKINYLLGWISSVHMILWKTHKEHIYLDMVSAPGWKAAHYRSSKRKLLISNLKAVSCCILHTYLCELVQFFSSHWTCSHKLWCTRN
jgi:hypothetical protein